MTRGIDVRECFGPPEHRDRDWRTIWAIKDELPRGSKYKSAILLDHDLAARIVDAEDARREANESDDLDEGPPPDDYDLTCYLLLMLIDAVQANTSATIAAGGVDPPSFKPMPRPVTAVDLVRDERRLAGMASLIDQFTHKPDTQ